MVKVREKMIKLQRQVNVPLVPPQPQPPVMQMM